MKKIRLFPLELRRLLQSRLTWLMVLLTVVSPLAGLALYKPATASTMLSMYLANPAAPPPSTNTSARVIAQCPAFRSFRAP